MSTAAENRKVRAQIIEALVIHGYLTTPQLATYTGLAITDEAMEKRLKRMKVDGLVEEQVVVKRPILRVPCWRASRLAIRLAGDALPYVKRIGASGASHALTVAQVAIDLRAAGHHVTTERELTFEEREHRAHAGTTVLETSHGSREVRVMPDGNRLRKSTTETRRQWYQAHTPAHRPDLRLDPADSPDTLATLPEAWEIELSPKKKTRVEDKLRWFARTSAYGRVVYLCATPNIAELVSQAAVRAAPRLSLEVVVLPPEYLAAALIRRTVVGRPVIVSFPTSARSAALRGHAPHAAKAANPGPPPLRHTAQNDVVRCSAESPPPNARCRNG